MAAHIDNNEENFNNEVSNRRGSNVKYMIAVAARGNVAADTHEGDNVGCGVDATHRKLGEMAFKREIEARVWSEWNYGFLHNAQYSINDNLVLRLNYIDRKK